MPANLLALTLNVNERYMSLPLEYCFNISRDNSGWTNYFFHRGRFQCALMIWLECKEKQE